MVCFSFLLITSSVYFIAAVQLIWQVSTTICAPLPVPFFNRTHQVRQSVIKLP